MARYSCGMVATIAGTAALPCFSIYSAAAVAPRLVEVQFFNTTATATGKYQLQRLTTAGTQGAAQAEVKFDPVANAAQCTAVAGHTVAPTLGDNFGYGARLPGVIGAGVIWTFGDGGLRIPVGTGNGIGLLCTTGTGQVLDVVFVWDE